MNKEVKKRSIWIQRVSCLFCAILALGVIFVLAYHNKDWKHVWFATGMNNDEVFYNRQIVGVLTYGQPKGIFGYNESTAQIGHFGGWGPLLIYLHALPSILVGAGINTVFWSNLIIFLLGWWFFVCTAKVSWQKQVALGIAFACIWLPLEQVFSGSSEPIQYTLLFLLFGACFAMKEKMRPAFFWVSVIACFLTTATRAYTVLLWLFPLAITWKKERKYTVYGIVAAIISLLCFGFSEVYCNAPYYDGMGTDTQGVQYLLEGKVRQAVLYELDRLREGITFLYQSTVLTLSGQTQEQGRAVLIFGVLFIVMVFCLVYDFLHKRKVLFKALTLFCIVLILGAIFLVYSAGVIQRHLIMLCVDAVRLDRRRCPRSCGNDSSVCGFLANESCGGQPSWVLRRDGSADAASRNYFTTARTRKFCGYTMGFYTCLCVGGRRLSWVSICCPSRNGNSI